MNERKDTPEKRGTVLLIPRRSALLAGHDNVVHVLVRVQAPEAPPEPARPTPQQAVAIVIDRSVESLRRLDRQFGSRLKTIHATADAIERWVLSADLVIGAVLVPGAAAPLQARSAAAITPRLTVGLGTLTSSKKRTCPEWNQS